ncbi:CD225/dispanin family protein [Flagellimonas maritima]
MPPKPDNYLVWAILSTIFCCIGTGIASIIYASKSK